MCLPGMDGKEEVSIWPKMWLIVENVVFIH